MRDGVVDVGQVPVGEFDVHDRSDDLDDAAGVLLPAVPLMLLYSACAPETTSMISRVIAAWRTLFM